MLVRLNEFACCSRTDSPFTHQRPRQRVVASFRLDRAPRFALRLPVIARRKMRPNRLLQPNTFSTTSTRASWIPVFYFSQSRDFRRALGRGIERFTTPNSLRRAVRLCFVGGRFLPQAFPGLQQMKPGPRAVRPYLWHLCRLPVSYPWRFRTQGSSSGSPRLHSPRVREDHTMSTTRDAFHR